MGALDEQLRVLFETHSWLAFSLAAASVAMLVVSAIALPWVVVRLPQDYYLKPRAPGMLNRHPALKWLVWVLRNTLGTLVLLAGIAMLLLPGQGLLTILLGLALVDFPRKHAAEKWLISRSSVFRSLNWLRRRAGKPPLRLPPVPPVDDASPPPR